MRHLAFSDVRRPRFETNSVKTEIYFLESVTNKISDVIKNNNKINKQINKDDMLEIFSLKGLYIVRKVS